MARILVYSSIYGEARYGLNYYGEYWTEARYSFEKKKKNFTFYKTLDNSFDKDKPKMEYYYG